MSLAMVASARSLPRRRLSRYPRGDVVELARQGPHGGVAEAGAHALQPVEAGLDVLDAHAADGAVACRDPRPSRVHLVPRAPRPRLDVVLALLGTEDGDAGCWAAGEAVVDEGREARQMA